MFTSGKIKKWAQYECLKTPKGHLKQHICRLGQPQRKLYEELAAVAPLFAHCVLLTPCLPHVAYSEEIKLKYQGNRKG